MDPFDEFARAIAADNPGKYTVPETNPESWKCDECGEFAVKRVVSSDGLGEIWFCDEHYKELQDSKKGKKKVGRKNLKNMKMITWEGWNLQQKTLRNHVLRLNQ